MHLDPRHFGTTVLLFNGEEDLIIGVDKENGVFLSETRSWDRSGKRIGAEDDSQNVLSEKLVMVWRVNFGGYERMMGSYTARELLVSDQHLARFVVEKYNARAKDHPSYNTPSNHVSAYAAHEVQAEKADTVFHDDLAREIAASDELYDYVWKAEQYSLSP